jgi:hypothetical protein
VPIGGTMLISAICIGRVDFLSVAWEGNLIAGETKTQCRFELVPGYFNCMLYLCVG